MISDTKYPQLIVPEALSILDIDCQLRIPNVEPLNSLVHETKVFIVEQPSLTVDNAENTVEKK